MPLQPFLAILESTPNIKREGQTYLFADETDATLFVTLGKDVMQVPKVSKLDKKDGLVHLTTQKGERFFFDENAIVGLSLGSAANKSKGAGAGFLPSGSVLSR